MVRRLEKFYGRPKAPKITDALELILLENVAYLADDEKRSAAFAVLKKEVGTRPEQILKTSPKQLEKITRMGGIVPELRAQRLRQIGLRAGVARRRVRRTLAHVLGTVHLKEPGSTFYGLPSVSPSPEPLASLPEKRSW